MQALDDLEFNIEQLKEKAVEKKEEYELQHYTLRMQVKDHKKYVNNVQDEI